MSIYEIIQSLILGVFDFFTSIYDLFVGSSVSALINFFESSYEQISTYGLKIIDTFFSRFAFTSDRFTDNFIYFFIGLLFFVLFLRIMFKLLSFLVSTAVEAVKGFIPFL